MLFVKFAQHPPRRHHVEEPHDDPGILTSQISNGVRWVGKKRLSRDDLDASLVAARFQVFDG